MATAPIPTSLDEYLNTSYSPDCEYIDGVVLERNVGKTKHAFTQTEVLSQLRSFARPLSFHALVEQRVRVSASRVRIPDVCVVRRLDQEVIVEPPLLCVEVFSPDDRWSRVNQSVTDYLAMGVPCVWIIDPYSRRAWIIDQEQPPAEVADGMLRASTLGAECPLSEVLPPAEI
jgi:Uma2 family endonuclease